MELIKQIKESEAQAQQIIERAKANSVESAEQDKASRLQAMEQAQKERKDAIAAAAAKAESQGLSEVQQLKAQAEENRKKLHQKVDGKMAAAVAKVMGYIKD